MNILSLLKHYVEKLEQSGKIYKKDGATWFKSSDYGATWERIYDLTWVNLSPDMTYGTGNRDNDFEILKTLINEDIDNNESI